MRNLATAPEKPARGAPCNGCGLCCAAEVCKIGLEAGLRATAPCEAMRFDGERFRCMVVETERRMNGGFPALVSLRLGIGIGCDSDGDA